MLTGVKTARENGEKLACFTREDHAYGALRLPKTSDLQSVNCSPIMSYLCQKCRKNTGVTDFVSDIKSVENYPDFEKKLAHVIQRRLRTVVYLKYRR